MVFAADLRQKAGGARLGCVGCLTVWCCCCSVARLFGRVGAVDVVKGGAEFFRAKCGAIFNDGFEFAGIGESAYLLKHVPVVGVVSKTR